MPLLERIGIALYGIHWKGQLSEALGVGERSLRRWMAAGEVPAGIWQELLNLMRARDDELRGLIAELERLKP